MDLISLSCGSGGGGCLRQSDRRAGLGWRADYNTALVKVIDPAIDQGSMSYPAQARAGPSDAVIGSTVLFAGGGTATNVASDAVDFHDTITVWPSR